MIAGGAVTLRPWERADVSFVFDCCQDADIQRWTRVPVPYTARHATSFVSAHARAQPEEGGAYFAIVRTDNGALLGSIGLNELDLISRSAEVGYWVAPDARGEGVAGMALDAIVGWAERELGLLEIRLVVDFDNLASRRVAERADFQLDGGDPTGEVTYIRRAAR